MIDRRHFVRIRRWVCGASLAAWTVLLVGGDAPGHGASRIAELCGGGAAAGGSLYVVAKSWVLMLIAMMGPTLIVPLAFIWTNSFARLRAGLAGLFVLGYGAVWMVAGVGLLVVALGVGERWPGSFWPALLAAAVAVVWQASPAKQICLNRCHRHVPLAAFGVAAVRDALGTGLVHGFWCVGSCWAMMLCPLLLPRGHDAAMAVVAVLMVCERLEPGAVPGWRLRGCRIAVLYATARLRERFRAVPA